LRGEPVENVTRLKQQDGREIVLTGSIAPAHAMIAAELVDEYRLLVYPTVQVVAVGSSPTATNSPA